jgi:hypothetical protein
MGAVVAQDGLLGGRGKQPIPGHANTLSRTADIFREVTRRFLSIIATTDVSANVIAPPG